MEKIFAEIKDSVDKEAEQLINRAKRVAEREIKYANNEAEKILSEHNFEMQKQAAFLEERERAHYSIDERKAELDQRQDFVEKIFNMALDEIKTLPRDEEYNTWIKNLLTNGLKNFKDNKVLVFSSEQDSKLVKKIAAQQNVKYSDDYLDIAGGIVLKSLDGRITVDLSAKAILNNKKDDLRSEVIERLTN